MNYVSMAEMRRRESHGETIYDVEMHPRGGALPSSAAHDWAVMNGQGDYAAISLSKYEGPRRTGTYWVFRFTHPDDAFQFRMIWG